MPDRTLWWASVLAVPSAHRSVVDYSSEGPSRRRLAR